MHESNEKESYVSIHETLISTKETYKSPTKKKKMNKRD